MNDKFFLRAKQSITEDIIKNYDKNGAVYIPNVLDAQEIECLTKGINLNLKAPSKRAKIASPSSDKGLFIEDFCTWQDNEYYKKIIFQSPLPAIAAILMQSQRVRLYHDHMLTKEPYTQTVTPWHQDLPYYNIDGMQNCSMWIPVDPVSEESTLEFVAGSHKGPWYIPRTFKDKEAKWFPEGSLRDLPTDQQLRQDNTILKWALSPGDIVLFNMLTIHSSKGVPVNQRRRVFSIRFMGDDTKFSPRPWPTSPDFPGLNDEMIAGSSMDHPYFPIVF